MTHIATLPAPFVQPDTRPIPGPWWRPSYVLAEDYVAEWRSQCGRTFRVVVPAGLPTDGSSEWLFTLGLGALPVGGLLAIALKLGPDGPHRAAAVAHDWIYGQGGDVEYQVLVGHEWHTMHGLTRAEADWAFRQLGKAGGLTWWQAGIRWAGLRMIGRPWWRSQRKDKS